MGRDEVRRRRPAGGTDTFSASVGGRSVKLHNVWAVSRGDAEGDIVVLAPRDSPPLSTQGANDDASGTAALVELAGVFSRGCHVDPIVFVSTDGDASGALGARAFLDQHRGLSIIAVVALRKIAGERSTYAYLERVERPAAARATVAVGARPQCGSLGR